MVATIQFVHMTQTQYATGCEVTIGDGAEPTVVHVEGDLDTFSAAQLRAAFVSSIGRGDVVVDISAVPFMDSAGLGALIGGIRRLREAGAAVAVCSARASVSRLLHTTGFDRIVPITGSLTDAIDVIAEQRTLAFAT